ncbi:ankyrin repeat domain-containing protein [Legionella jordanis]|uniref:Dot/Icm T4SS effector n=1 Tax=Legionella jordanis TaxID=456 RepID=A0A0W0VAD1_9GAMM|nr:ankyrin repeat domain-containing protein [Legionella jordanis]KTD17084.1 Dot/Icm T4SS effector [Legionella jordanis]RMX03217.1 ankyrin repeat domain-containing protein [Legionella jordanis]RMX18643.1 ankyrin repeat domain-containing protein [Legionella jordanis]VEH12719.1 Dot/Icm T4SS effector [Legionella jordanis]
MSQITEQVRIAIQKLPNERLKNFLLSHLSDDAQHQTQLFSKQYSFDRTTQEFSRANCLLANGLSFELLLNTVFVYAPTAVCCGVSEILLDCKDQELVDMLSQTHQHHSDAKANEWLMETIMHAAPKEVRLKICKRIKSLTQPDQIIQVLFGQFYKRDFNHFMQMLNFKDEECCIQLLSALGTLDSTSLFNLFQTSPFPTTSYDALIDFFTKHPPEAVAEAALQLLYRFEGHQLVKLIFGGCFLSASSCNLLHPVLDFYSEPIIAELLDFLSKRMSETDLEKLFTQRASIESCNTALELAFLRRDNMAVATMLAKFIYRRPSLRPLLTSVSISQFYSPMHLAALNNNYESVRFFVEQTDALVEHTVHRQAETMLTIAQKQGNKEVVAILQAWRIQNFIANYRKQDNQSLAWIKDLIAQQPEVISLAWNDGKTLLSHAASKGIDTLVLLLLDAGAIPREDVYGITPIEEALKVNSLEVLKAFTQSGKSNELVLQQLLSSFLKLKKPKPSYHELQLVLKQAREKQSFAGQIEDYCIQKNDCFIFLTLEIAKLLSSAEHSADLVSIKFYLEQSLQKLASNSCDYLEINALQIQLIIFLFSIEPSYLFSLLYSLNLDQDSKKTLQIVLARGLVQTAVFSKLSLEQHQLYYRFLRELLPEEPNSMQSIITVHFQDSQMTLLPAVILRELSSYTSAEDLFNFSKQRLNASLLVLTIEKLLEETPNDEEKLKICFKQLTSELKLFSKGASPAELEQMLNVACHPKIKAFLKNAVTQDTYLKGSTQLLFTQYKKDFAVLKNSLLYDLFFEYSTSFELLTRKENHKAFIEYVSTLSAVEVQQIIAKLQNNVHAHLLLAGIFSPVAMDNAVSSNVQFCQWLYQLESKKQRLSLGSLVNHLDQIQDQVKLFLEILKNEQNSNSYIALQQLQSSLERVASSLFYAHLNRTGLAWNDQLEMSLEALNQDFRFVRQIFQAGTIRLPAEELRTFKYAIAEDTIRSLKNQIKATCKQIDEDLTEHSKAMQDVLKNEAHLIAVFEENEQDIPQESVFAAQKQYLSIDGKLKNLSQIILLASLENPNCHELFTVLFEQMSLYGTSAQKDLLFSKLPDLWSSSQKEHWVEVDKQINNLLFLKEQISPLLIDLQILGFSDFNIEALIEVLYETKEEQLNQFACFCNCAALADLKAIADYVLSARNEQVPLSILKSHNNLNVSKHSSLWLQEKLTHIETRASDAMSYLVLKTGYLRTEQQIDEQLIVLNETLNQHEISPSAKAIQLLLSSYAPLFKANPSAQSHAFILAFSRLTRNTSIEVMQESMSLIPTELMESLLSHCLAGLNSEDGRLDQACRQILSNLCQLQFSSNKSMLERIKQQLGKQDLSVLADESLISIADDILSSSDENLEMSTFNGVWIQRLICSPRFIAASNPQVLKALIDRYRFISLTLKQDEFDQLNRWLKKNLAFYTHHQESMSRLDKAIISDPKRREYFLKKRQRLLEFRADDSIRALLNQLEDNCFEEKQHDPDMAEAALDVLYSHYNNSLSSLRSDFLFKVADFVIGRASRSKGDLAQAQNNLLKWLMHYLPHKNFEQHELSRKNYVALYDAQGAQIGFVNEANCAMALVDDEPCSLLDVKGCHAGMSLYDANRCLIGTLTTSGELKRENLFQRETSALLIAKVPTEQLSKSPAALELLLTDVFTENTLYQLYTKSDQEKQAWIEEQVSLHLAETKKTIHKDNMLVFAKRHSSESIFQTLANIKSKQNGSLLFEILLQDEQKRTELFNPEHQKEVFSFFNHIDVEQLLADFLIHHHSAPWFARGLQLFGQFASKSGQPELLAVALSVLHERSQQQKLITEATYDSILTTLLRSESCTTVIWNNFLQATEHSTIADVNQELAEDLTSFFQKGHCIPLIESLNEQQDWVKSTQYRFVLLMLSKQRKQIFHERELRYSEKIAWSQPELKQISRFANRHFKQPNSPDHNGRIGKKLFSELLFRCANFGQIELFYDKNGRFDPKVAGTVLERSFLNAIAARDYIPAEIRSSAQGIVSEFKSWFDDTHKEKEQITQFLKQNQALLDWKELCRQSWSMSDSLTSMPAISAYLINYSGTPAALNRLLQDYLNSKELQNNPRALHAISQIMEKFPARDISNCIFSTFEEILTSQPQLLDETIFGHMAHFYAHKQNKKDLQSPKIKLELIKHFGLQKKYGLVQQCCDLVAGRTQSVSAERILQQAQLEAKVEGQLSHFLNSWFFSIIRFFKRWWHYGFSAEKHLSKFVTPCDGEICYASPISQVKQIKTPVLSGQIIADKRNTAIQLKALRKRYETFLEKQNVKPTAVKSEHLAPGKFGLFSPCKEERTPGYIANVALVN